MAISRNIFWIAFFASILAAWWWLYSMSLSMNMDLLGRMSMENSMAQMDMPKENMSQMSDDGDMATMKGMNCLLYTSPSPRDLSTSRMPSSA